jgi:hypothetical protein
VRAEPFAQREARDEIGGGFLLREAPDFRAAATVRRLFGRPVLTRSDMVRKLVDDAHEKVRGTRKR